MAERFIYIAQSKAVAVRELKIDFQYFSGFALAQKQRSIEALHKSAAAKGIEKVLEISTKSTNPLGVKLSAFNLSTRTRVQGFEFTVERAFQGSKVFDRGGPYTDILRLSSLEAKRDPRLRESGAVRSFKFFDLVFDRYPPTFFYDWLYINTLLENPELVDAIQPFAAFSDIEFNWRKSINCQAYSAALFRSLMLNGVNRELLREPRTFLLQVSEEYRRRWQGKDQPMTQASFDFTR